MNGRTDGDGTRYNNRAEDEGRFGISRRVCLKLVGTAAVSATAVVGGSDPARAASPNYGGGGLGEGEYGDDGVHVSTRDATSVGTTSATLNGKLADLDGTASVDCYFEWRQIGGSSWTTTEKRTLSSTGSYAVSLSGLEAGVEHEFRAVGATSDGDTDTGQVITFITGASSTAPTIDSYSVTEADSPNPHIEITADWRVSDSDGDLDTVHVAVIHSSGTTIVSTTGDVSGASDAGTDSFTINHASDQTYDVTLTVTDTEGNESSRVETVTE